MDRDRRATRLGEPPERGGGFEEAERPGSSMSRRRERATRSSSASTRKSPRRARGRPSVRSCATSRRRARVPGRPPPRRPSRRAFRPRAAPSRRRASGGRAAYGVVTVTALAKKEGPRAPTPAEEARGTAWGRVLHQLLEAAMRSPGTSLAPSPGTSSVRRRSQRSSSETSCASRIRHELDLWMRARKARAATSRCLSRWSSRRKTSDSRGGPTRRCSRARWTSSSRRTASGTSWTGSPTPSATASPPRRALHARRSSTTGARGGRSRGRRRRRGSSSWTRGIWYGSEKRRKRGERREDSLKVKAATAAARPQVGAPAGFAVDE